MLHTLSQLLAWAKANDLANSWSDLAGVLLSVIGFALTLTAVFRSKTAAEQARKAAEETRKGIRLLDTVVDFSAAIALLEEIKRSHRQQQWGPLPDKYAAIRKVLITLRNSRIALKESQETAIQNAVVNLVDIERRVEKALADKSSSLNYAKINSLISEDIDNLLAVMTQLKASEEVHNES
jgi:hypothetical protein